MIGPANSPYSEEAEPMSDQTVARGVRHTSALDNNRKAAAIHATAEADPPIATSAPQQLERPITVWPIEGAPHLQLEHLGATIGTVVHGVDMAAASDEDIAILRSLLAARKVLFFRDQHCSETEHINFSRRFGPLEIHPFNPMHPVYDEIIPIHSGPSYVGAANTWHSDVMWRMEPSLGSLLRAKSVPEVGGDTLFSDMTAAYRGLSDSMKARVDGLMAINSGAANGSKETARQRLVERGASADELAEFDETYANVPIPVHPVIRTHPDTGQRAIYVNRAFTRRIVGVDRSESDELLQELLAQAAIPEYQCRFRWEPGSVAFWDNRSAQHYASSDYWPERRRMERVTVAGDLPYFRHDDGEVITTYAADEALLSLDRDEGA